MFAFIKNKTADKEEYGHSNQCKKIGIGNSLDAKIGYGMKAHNQSHSKSS